MRRPIYSTYICISACVFKSYFDNHQYTDEGCSHLIKIIMKNKHYSKNSCKIQVSKLLFLVCAKLYICQNRHFDSVCCEWLRLFILVLNRETQHGYICLKNHLISISISMIRNTTQNDDFLASTDQLSSHAKLKYDANGILWLVLNYYPKGFISQFHLNVIAQSERASVGWGRRSRWIKLLKYSLSFWGVITGTLFQIPKRRPHITWHVRIHRIYTWSLFFGRKLENVIMEMV